MNNNILKRIVYKTIKIVTPFLSNQLYSRIIFRYNCMRFKRPYYQLNINEPKTFNEKICYFKFNERNMLAPIVADKFAVREYVKEQIGENYLIPLIKKFDSPDEIEIYSLHEDCILKMNNGSGANLIYKKNSTFSIGYLQSFFKKAFSTDIYFLSREWHYREIKPCIVVEKLLDDNINDYKFFCNPDGPFAIQVDVDRYINHKRNIYDLDWNLLPYKISHSNADNEIEKPKNLNKMIEIVKILCKDFIFSRIDLYEHNNNIWFGEITLFPGGGTDPFESYEQDLEFGKKIYAPYPKN